MASYTLNPVVDPDALSYQVNVSFASATAELVINTSALTIALKVQGNLTTDGATIKAVYSKLKDAWRTNATLIKFLFPMGPITDEQFELINGWNWDKTNTSGPASQTTTQLLRTGGWSVVTTAGNIIEQWAGVITLGTLGSTDQVYYQLVDQSTPAVDFTLTGPVNQAVQVLSDPNGDGSYGDGFDRRTYFRVFVREWQKLYAQSEIDDIGVVSMSYQAYRFPLSNTTDTKVTHTELQIDANSDGAPDQGVYGNVVVEYLRDSNGDVYNILTNFATATSYSIGDVVKDVTDGHWYKCILGYTSDAVVPSANTTNWSIYEGERLIGAAYYPFTVIIDGDNTVGASVSGSASIAQIYEAVQYLLRQDSDIDVGTGSVTGKTAPELVRFVGDNLVTSTGVYIDSFNTQDINSITFTDAYGTPRNYPYISALRVNIGANLQNDQYSKYWVFFTNANGNTYGSENAIIVQDNAGNDMAGDVNPSWPVKREFVSHSFAYDSNTQGGRTPGVDAAITVVGLGLSTGQFVAATGTIAKSTANTVTLTSALERNYSTGTVTP